MHIQMVRRNVRDDGHIRRAVHAVQLEAAELERGKILRPGIFPEQRLRHTVHHFIRALCGKNGGHQKLKRGFMYQKTFLRTVSLQQNIVNYGMRHYLVKIGKSAERKVK